MCLDEKWRCKPESGDSGKVDSPRAKDMRLLGIEFAPLKVPMKRRLETAAAFFWIFVPLICPLLAWTTVIYILLYTRFYYVPLLYFGFQYFDKNSPYNGGKPLEPVRDLACWKYLCQYFPLSTFKTAECPPDTNYLFCIYPHGVLSTSGLVHFATNGSDFHDKFPGLKTYFATLDVHFRTPIVRDFILALGIISSDKRSLLYLLNPERKGNAIALILGGAQEALYAKPNSYTIVLKNRKGFIRLALQTGASIVPVYGFHENDLYDQVPNPPGSLLFRIQEWIKKKTGLAPIIPIGRGVFQYSFGIIPRRAHVTSVYGAPIKLPLERIPTEESVEKYHAIFTEALINLFEEHKEKYLENAENIHLEIV
uniref:Acyltransferase n=3 Tax=Lygus hesperus TaxID=30085 RepID=A0A0A9XCV1_LYGHE